MEALRSRMYNADDPTMSSTDRYDQVMKVDVLCGYGTVEEVARSRADMHENLDPEQELPANEYNALLQARLKQEREMQ